MSVAKYEMNGLRSIVRSSLKQIEREGLKLMNADGSYLTPEEYAEAYETVDRARRELKELDEMP